MALKPVRFYWKTRDLRVQKWRLRTLFPIIIRKLRLDDKKSKLFNWNLSVWTYVLPEKGTTTEAKCRT